MSIDNVQNLNKLELYKLAQQKNGQQVKGSNQPDYMKSTGSIFNAPKTDSTAKQVLAQFREEHPGLFGKSETEKSQQQPAAMNNASDGKQAAAQANNQKNDASQLKTQTNKDSGVAAKFDRDSVKLGKQIGKNQKTFEQTMQKNEKLVQANQLKMAKATDGINESQIEVDALTAELESLTAGDKTGVGTSSAFSLSLGGAQSAGNNPASAPANPNADRINELGTQLGSKVDIMDGYGKQIYTLQSTSNKTIKMMNTMSNNQVKVNTVNQKNLNSQVKETSDIIKIADKVEQVGATTAQVGMTVNYAGKGLVALGASMTWAGGSGAALIATGNVMQKTGTVTEMVGNYAQFAGSATKAVSYAAEGNLMAAVSSAGTAIMSGGSAMKASKDLGKSFDAINQQSEKATQKLAANVQAKEIVKNASTEELGGMTAKEAKKSISADLRSQMAEDPSFAGKNFQETGDALRATEAKAKEAGGGALQKSTTQYTDIVANSKGNTTAAKRALSEASEAKTEKLAAKSAGVSAQKIGESLTSYAAKMGQTNPNATGTKAKGTVNITYSQGTQNVINKNAARREAVLNKYRA